MLFRCVHIHSNSSGKDIGFFLYLSVNWPDALKVKEFRFIEVFKFCAVSNTIHVMLITSFEFFDIWYVCRAETDGRYSIEIFERAFILGMDNAVCYANDDMEYLI